MKRGIEVMKLSLRFEKMIAARKLEETSKTMSDGDILSELFARYNSYKANSALRRWQITTDQQSAIIGVILGMTHESRMLIRAHLDFNKYDESGHSTTNLTFFPHPSI